MNASPTMADVLAFTPRPYLQRARAYPFLKWAGGKRAIVPEIAQRLPETLGTYWEPFVGGGAVFFALDNRIQAAQLSDVNTELVITYQVVRNQPKPLIAALTKHATHHDRDYYYATRKLGNRRSAQPLDEVTVAARMVYLNKTCYNGLYRVNRRGEFNAPIGSYKKPTICDAENIHAASTVLNKATIQVRDFAAIKPAAGDFVYCDPPYDGAFAGYDALGFTEEDQARLCAAVHTWHQTGATVMISNADTDLVRELYSEPPFVCHSIAAPRTISRNGKQRGAVSELLVTTYDCKRYAG